MLQLCRYFEPGIGTRLGAVTDGNVYDLTSLGKPGLATFRGWLERVDEVGISQAVRELEDAVGQLLLAHRWEDLYRAPSEEAAHVLAPLDRQEVWAAGVTYLRSRVAREEESERSGIYDRVYDAERPEIFFKATPHRTVGPLDFIYIRADSSWNVPEPELTVVLTPGLQIAGFTAGNDVSSRDIEGANPLYLPQAKTYDRSCALGPAVTVAPDFDGAKPAAIDLTIRRGDQISFEGGSSTGRMKRTVGELVSFLGRHNTFPNGVFLMTGTGVVPPDDYTLEAGDVVEIGVERVGTLVNVVAEAPERG
jgi:2-dehydro-3-deoxy-D-arabinonate dehydratase